MCYPGFEGADSREKVLMQLKLAKQPFAIRHFAVAITCAALLASCSNATAPAQALKVNMPPPPAITQSAITPSGVVFLAGKSVQATDPPFYRYTRGGFSRLGYLPVANGLLAFPNRKTGFGISRSGGRIFATKDGGHHWTKLYNFAVRAIGIGFQSAKRGYVAVLRSVSATGGTEEVANEETSNGGVHWHATQPMSALHGSQANFAFSGNPSYLMLANAAGQSAYSTQSQWSRAFVSGIPHVVISSAVEEPGQATAFTVLGHSLVIAPSPTPGNSATPLPLLVSGPSPAFLRDQPAWLATDHVAFENLRLLGNGAVVAVSSESVYVFTPSLGWYRAYPKLAVSEILRAKHQLGVVTPKGQQLAKVGSTAWGSLLIERNEPSGATTVERLAQSNTATAIASAGVTSGPFQISTGAAGFAIARTSATGSVMVTLSSLSPHAPLSSMRLSFHPLALAPLSTTSLWVASTSRLGDRKHAGTTAWQDYLAFSDDQGRSWIDISVGANNIEAIDYATPKLVIATLSPYATPSYSFLVTVVRSRRSITRMPIPPALHTGFVAVFVGPNVGWLQSTSLQLGPLAHTTHAGVSWTLESAQG